MVSIMNTNDEHEQEFDLKNQQTSKETNKEQKEKDND